MNTLERSQYRKKYYQEHKEQEDEYSRNYKRTILVPKLRELRKTQDIYDIIFNDMLEKHEYTED
jgi:hypothetical protein